MAQLFPSLSGVRTDGGRFRELDVLERLEASLPSGFSIFHSVAWHSLHEGDDRHGEIDIVILAPSGNILLMEVKAGDVILRNGAIFKLYKNREHNVAAQIKVQFGAMVNRLTEANLHAHVTTCLTLPDFAVGDTRIVSYPRERIIDATEFDQLGTRVKGILAIGESRSEIESIRRFLSNEFEVAVDLRVLGDQVRTTSQRLADGLATWVPRIDAPSGAIRVRGTAGSGKTQLALRLLNDAHDHGKRTLYVCYNRALADHIIRLASPHITIVTFHELCRDHYVQEHGEPDFAESDIFKKMEATYCDYYAQNEPSAFYDLILIDEGQDFEPAWVASLLGQLAESGKVYLLEDESQRLYPRDEFDLADAVTVTCHDNFRSPRTICLTINALGLGSHSVNPRSPYEGEPPDFLVYENDDQMIEKTEQAVKDLVARGIRLADIAVISGRGRAKSLLQKADHIGKFSTQRFTGSFTEAGDPVWTKGDLLVESVFRFKGQSAAGIVFSELDFFEMTDLERRKLFVGMTRAHLAVTLVMSTQAEACFAKLLDQQ